MDVWQDRFKAFPIGQDAHYLIVLRYVEQNPLRAERVTSAADWRWSSVSRHNGAAPTNCSAQVPWPQAVSG